MARMTPVENGSMLGVNPYNKQKEWDEEGKTGKEFVSSDESLAYVNKPKYAAMDTMTNQPEAEATNNTVAPQEPQEDRFNKVDYKKRYDDLKRHYDKKVNEFKGKEQELREQINSNTPKYTPPSSPEELEKFKEENPAIYNVVETVAHMQADKQLADLQKELTSVQEKLAMADAQRAYAELKMLVPDFEEIRQSEDFHIWAEQQPEEIQNWVYKNRTNVQLAAQAVNLYKANRGMTTPSKQPTQTPAPQPQRSTGADVAIPTRSVRDEPSDGKKMWTREEIGRLSSKQYEKLRDEIDAAFAEGRIVGA